MEEAEKEEAQKKILEALKEAGYEPKLEGGEILIITKNNKPLSKDECIKLVLIMRNNGYTSHFRHPESCLIMTDSYGIIVGYENDLFVFSGQETFQRFVENFCPADIGFFPHLLKWQTIVDRFSGEYNAAILDYDGQGVYKHIPLIKSSEIGGMA